MIFLENTEENVDKEFAKSRANIFVIKTKETMWLIKGLIKYPKDIKEIQLQIKKVWNCDEVGFGPNGKWTRVISAPKWYKTPENEIWRKRYALV